MKEVNVTFKSDGKIQSIDADSIFLEEENLSVKITASFPSDLTISGVRAYIRTNSGVQDCITPVLADGKYTLTLSSDKLEKGILKIGFEITSSSALIRFAPVVLNVDGFISDDYIISKKLYTVSVSVADTQTVDSTQNASVENVGSSKEVKLKFKIPKGEKGDKGDMPAVTDSLDSDSTTAALSANQGKVLNEILNKKLTVYSAAESELDSLVIPSGESEGRLYQVTGIGSSSPSYFVFVYVKETRGQVTNSLGKTYTTTFNLCAQMRIKYDVQTSEGEIIRSHNAISTRYQTSKTAWSDWVDIADSTDLEGKVDKADGKGLSTNDFTNAHKAVADCMEFDDGDDMIHISKGVTVNDRIDTSGDIYTLGGSVSVNYGNVDVANGDVICSPSAGGTHQLSKKADAPTIQTAVTNNTLILADKTETLLLSSDTASLTLTTPASIFNDYECAFSFKSGATATTLVYAATPITWRGTDCEGDFTPQANVSYEVSIKCLGTDADNNPVVVARVGAF